MISLAIPNLSGNEEAYLRECISSTFVSSVGQYVNRLENDIAHETHAQRANAVSFGKTGLHAALCAVGVKQGDLVILPSYTFIASANAISYCGAMPWLMDISATSLACPH